MKQKYSRIGLTIALAFATCQALAANPVAVMTIEQSDGKSWAENVSGLLSVDANGDFGMKSGTGTTGFYQNGQFVSTIDTANHPDYWQWLTDSTGQGYWNWHTAETLNGSSPGTTTPDNPWVSVLNLKNIGGHGDPDLSYAFSAVNNNATSTQTFTFVIGEQILPVVNGANMVHADIAGGLTTKDGNVTIAPFGTSAAIQKLELSADNGNTFVNAGVDVGPQMNANTTTTYGTFAADASGPMGPTWNYMQLSTKFTLTAKDSASLVGYGSITPVPEPETFGMVLTGLGLMGLMVRRKQA